MNSLIRFLTLRFDRTFSGHGRTQFAWLVGVLLLFFGFIYLYRESVRREELILNEQTNDELQNLKIEIKRKDLKIAEQEKEIKKIKEGK